MITKQGSRQTLRSGCSHHQSSTDMNIMVKRDSGIIQDQNENISTK